MEWYLAFLLLIGTFFFLILLGVPVVFAFFGVNIIYLGYFMGEAGFELLIDGVYGSLSVFVLLPITLFILMGEVLFRTGIAMKMINTLDTWMGAIPGRLSLLAIGSGTLLATLSGASIGTTAMLIRTLTPAMQERGYSKSLSIGPLLGSGGLAIMIPPSALGVILAVIASVSVGKLLIAIIIPGILLALAYIVYVVLASRLDPSAAPAYSSDPVPLGERLVLTAKYILPLSIIIFLVIGVVFLGVATPTEAAALGTAGAFGLAACYGRLTWSVTVEALMSTLRISVMVLAILAASKAFTQLLAYTGATQELIGWATALPIPPIWVIVMMHLITLFLGGPIGGIPLIMMTVPIFLPVVTALGYDPIWFCVAMLINVELAQITPPFGVLLYVAKGILHDTTMGEITRAAVPIIICNLIVMALLIAIPALSLWLPAQMLQ
ncbi:TRAP transporter large permease subunit [Aquibium sp. A9E412]|uniref:TRAP transporter large permease n=1 Tax=Aquibium sp. A9E412 TaxID=2976767 RepID=UPI0025B0311C|nr:TRAP transporter large permease subunit [Aquibium sp. A9E412]MDN2564646.1 TRAP transporter large permease subunit [Aquibium sp. A9E412]